MYSNINCPTGYYSVAVHPNNINIWYTSILSGSRVKGASGFSLEDFCSEKKDDLNHQSEKSPKPEQFADNDHHGLISKIAAKKITRAIDYLVYVAKPKRLPDTLHGKGFKFKISFITLTLSSPQVHPDAEIMSKIFQPFLNNLRQKFKVNNYIWRAEKQANGNVHYHICTDKFIHWSDIRNCWNKHQQSLGYVTRYRNDMLAFHKEGFKFRLDLANSWPLEKQFKAYVDGTKNDWDNPNSTDVHSLKLVNNIRAYFIKYMTKSGQSSDIVGRLWGCSLSLSALKGGQTELVSDIETEVLKLIQSCKCQFFNREFFSCLFYNAEVLNKRDYPALFDLLSSFIRAVFKPD